MNTKAILVSILAVALTGCHKASPIVGSWTAPDTVTGPGGSDTWAFAADGQLKHVIVAKRNGKSATITSTGTYTFKDNRLTLNVGEATDVHGSGKVTHPFPAYSVYGDTKWSDNDHIVVTVPVVSHPSEEWHLNRLN